MIVPKNKNIKTMHLLLTYYKYFRSLIFSDIYLTTILYNGKSDTTFIKCVQCRLIEITRLTRKILEKLNFIFSQKTLMLRR